MYMKNKYHMLLTLSECCITSILQITLSVENSSISTVCHILLEKDTIFIVCYFVNKYCNKKFKTPCVKKDLPWENIFDYIMKG